MDPTQVIRDDDGVFRCRQCGFRYDLSPDAVTERAESAVGVLAQAVEEVPEAFRNRRPEPAVWSVNAYTAHLAEAMDVLNARMHAIVEEDRPAIHYWDEQRAVEEGRADEQSAEESLVRVRRSAARFCREAGSLPQEAWNRTGLHPAGEISVRDVAHDVAHELEHHTEDVRRVGQRVGQRVQQAGA